LNFLFGHTNRITTNFESNQVLAPSI
jgi:hypothetical protein